VGSNKKAAVAPAVARRAPSLRALAFGTPALLALALPLAGCGGVLDPEGPVGASEKLILLDSLAIMLAIVVPVILATIGFAWWFRASNARATYLPNWAFSGHLELIVWAIPTLVITFLGGIAWFGSHALDPYRSLPSPAKPIEIEVVSLDWKWLFIYPGEGIAAVNQLVLPAGMPVHFRLTSTGVMNSFFVPQLGSQIYTMAGMTTQVSLQADRPGSYPGLSAQFSGAGFADMRFEVKAMSAADYAAWVAAAKAAGPALDEAAYAALGQPSPDVKPMTYKAVEPGLFRAIVAQTAPQPPGPGATPGGQDQPPAKKGM
jgi:cytochrome o ubiquinol oxidase subunit II